MILADCIILLVGGFIVGALVMALAIAHEIRVNEAQQECEEPRQWFVRFSYRRIHFNNYAPPTQWYSTYKIIECDDVMKVRETLRNDLLFPNSKDDVELRIYDIHEL